MTRAARRLATIPGLLAALALPASIAQGCAAGSDEPSDDAGAAIDAPVDTSVDAQGDSALVPDSKADEVHPDAATDDADARGGGMGDADASDATSTLDATDAADAADAADAGPRVIFGATCPTGTTYTEPFTSDPVNDGTFLPLIGSYSYSANTQTFSITSGSPNAQLWIGARPSWTNYTISVPIRIDSGGGNGGINFRMQSTPSAPANNAGQMYFAGIATNQVLLGIENGNWTEFAGPSASFSVATFYTLQVTVTGSSLSVSVNGTPYVTNYSDGTYLFGSFGLRTFSSGMTYGTITVTCN